MTKSTRTRKRNTRSGAALVEVALVLPLLFLFLFAGYEFTRANMLRHTVQSAAYEGARRGIVPGATTEMVQDAVRGSLATVGVVDATIEVDPGTITPSTTIVTVTVTAPLSSNTVMSPIFLRNASMRGVCEMTAELSE